MTYIDFRALGHFCVEPTIRRSFTIASLIVYVDTLHVVGDIFGQSSIYMPV